MVKYFLLGCLSLLLVSCDQTIELAPFLDGTFVGEYGSPDSSERFPLRLESSVVSGSSQEYSVEGTLTLGGTAFAMTGTEQTGRNLEYIRPQVAPIDGSFTLHAKQAEGIIYTIEGSIFYGTLGWTGARADKPRFLNGIVCRTQQCSSETIVGNIFPLTKEEE